MEFEPQSTGLGHDYIPAFKSSGRMMSAADAFRLEADELDDAELDLRFGNGSKVSKVFMNSTYEAANEVGSLKAQAGVNYLNTIERGYANRMDTDRRYSPDTGPMRNLNASRPAFADEQNRPGEFSGRRNSTSVKVVESAPVIATRISRPIFNAPASSASAIASTAITFRKVPSSANWESDVKHLLAGRSRLEGVLCPAPPTTVGLVQCYVRRCKGFLGTHPTYMMHMDSGDVFLLGARRRKKSKTSSFVISQDIADLKRDTENCVAKVKANFAGTEYVLWGKSESRVRRGYSEQHMCIGFGNSVTQASAPRTMHVVLPLPEAAWKPDGDRENLSDSLEAAQLKRLPSEMERKACLFVTKRAEYDCEIKSATLDFHGRVKKASTKNFQLVSWDSTRDRRGNDVVLQFGKVEEDLFALDFSYPFSIESAFAVALASIDTKLCYAI